MKIFFVLLFFSGFVFSQQPTFSNDLKIKSSPFSLKSYGVSKVNFYYKFTFVPNKNMPTNIRETICVLQIGDNVTKFVDFYTLKQDSLKRIFSQQSFVVGNDLNQLMKYKVLWPSVNLKTLDSNKVIQQNRIKRLYQYEEDIPLFNWKLIDEKKSILGYNCYKAEVRFRGRDYVAWYTKEVNVNNGPYLFQNLPGLILELYDIEKRYHFIAEGVDRKPLDIYLEDDKSIISVTREKFREVQKNYFENPGAFHGTAYNEDKSIMSTKPNSTPYNPMELE